MTNESKTLFIPLYGKALMSREGLWTDERAQAIADDRPELFANVDKSRKLAIYMTMRAMQYDECVRDYIRREQDAVVIHLGCGLDSRFLRAGQGVHRWYDVDLPQVIDVRREYDRQTQQYRMIAASVTQDGWLDEVEGRRALVVAEGLSMYLTREDMRTLFMRLRKRFDRVELLFDAYSSFAARMSRYRNPINAVKAHIDYALDDAHEPETYAPDVRCIRDADIILPQYVQKLHGIDRLRFVFMGRAGKRLYRIYGYHIGA